MVILSLLIVPIIAYHTMIWMYIALYRGNESYPEVTYGEFPFELVYELDGEIKRIEDTIICEFSGFKFGGTRGTMRVWNMRYKSGRDELLLLDLKEDLAMDKWGNKILSISFYPGNAEYYMDDERKENQRKSILTEFTYISQRNNGDLGKSVFSADEAWDKYKIRLISWECSPPIENKFKQNNNQ